MRYYGSVPPVLSTAQAPAVSATTGLGTGGGAGVFSKGTPADGQGFGWIELFAGVDAATGGSVTLVFATTPPLLFLSPNTASFGTLSAPNNDGAHTTIVVSWTGKLAAGRHRIDYEWSVSQ